mgnify:CR=1 FL=1|jgi:hypothetical protein|tara:strand:+ start:88 stop:225 length:138 start_codon:yes stop_codon:yes gene_type:complete
MSLTDDLFYELDSWVYDREKEGVPLNEIIDIVQEYLEILKDVNYG